MPGHVPVLLSVVLRTFELKSGQTVIDATLGGGGHASAMLARTAPTGRLLGIEADPKTIPLAREKLRAFGDRVVIQQGNFARLSEIARDHGFGKVDAVLYDLGISSLTIEDATRGFSFSRPGPLDMRFDPEHQTLTAAQLVNSSSKEDLVEILRAYGEERLAYRIVETIIERRRQRRFTLTDDLAEVIARSVPRRGRLHPATRTFQALRIAVNDELGALRTSLPQAFELLKADGRLGVISFHSLEDRIVKHWMRAQVTSGQATIITKKPIRPSRTEIVDNPRARSAIYRVIQKTISQK